MGCAQCFTELKDKLLKNSLISIAELLESYEPLAGLRANFVVNLAGDFQDASGSSRGISSPEDRQLLIHLRRLSDLVLVSAETAAIEKLSSTKATTLAIVAGASAMADIPALAPGSNSVVVLAAANASREVFLDQSATAQLTLVQNETRDKISPAELLEACESLGFDSLLSEFGPNWLRQLDAVQLVDELCLTITKSENQQFDENSAVKALGILLPSTKLQLSSTLEVGDNLFTRWRPTSPRRGNRLGDQ